MPASSCWTNNPRGCPTHEGPGATSIAPPTCQARENPKEKKLALVYAQRQLNGLAEIIGYIAEFTGEKLWALLAEF
jgi:hypothetical protein